MGVGGPDLGAVEDVVIAILLGEGLQGGQIGTGARLGIALAPEVFAAENLGQILFLLFLGAAADQAGATHVQAHGNQRRRLGTDQLLREDGPLAHTPAGATEFLRPVRRRPALVVEDALPGQGFLHRRKHRGHHFARFPNLRGQALLQKGAYLIAKRLLLLRHLQIHTLLRCYQTQWNQCTAGLMRQ